MLISEACDYEITVVIKDQNKTNECSDHCRDFLIVQNINISS